MSPVPHWKALGVGKHEPRKLSCGSAFKICQGILKSVNLVQKQGSVKAHLLGTLNLKSNIFQILGCQMNESSSV